MGLETGTTISQLDATWPLGGDQKSQGDNHLRLIKSLLKTQFPGSGGLGFNVPITATESDLNALPQLLLDRAAFIVAKNANQTIPASTITDILWQTETYDNKNGFASNQFVIPTGLAGLWLFAVELFGNATFNIKINGVIVSKTISSGLILKLAVVANGDIIKVTCPSQTTAEPPLVVNSVDSMFFGFKII